MKHDFELLLARYKRSPFRLRGHGVERELALLSLTNDRLLAEHVGAWLDDLEAQYLACPFLEPDSAYGLDQGDVHIVNTTSGKPIYISFG